MSILLYEEYALAKRQAFARTKDTEKTITITLAVGKGVIVDAYAINAETGEAITKAAPGTKIQFTVQVRNDGDPDYIWFTVKDKDTATLLWDPLETYLLTGKFVKGTGPATPLTMPNKTWNLLIEAGHGKA
jgi:hypothetical protein